MLHKCCFSLLVSLAALALLSACSGSHRPVYSGHEQSTDGVPGFVNGKRVSPHVKLGQSYTVDGKTYVPRNQPDYVEEGMASWYGPGFHGGKTANGELFDSDELTAAHRTLPLPSIVRVTLLSSGKQAYVRINDRGPFAHSRIIDLSRKAAEKIGLLGVGVGKVRVQYMAAESQRFADFLAQGRDPKSIDIASEVLNYNMNNSGTSYARADVRVSSVNEDSGDEKGFWESLGLVSDSHAAAPVSSVSSADIVAPAQEVASAAADGNGGSPFAVLNENSAAPTQEVAALTVEPQPVATNGYYVQLGAFSNAANAEKLRGRYTKIEALELVKKINAEGKTLYHVRTRLYASANESGAAHRKLQAAGATARIFHE